MRLLSEEQAQEIFKSEHCNISKDLAGILYRAIEAAVLEAQGKQEPVAEIDRKVIGMLKIVSPDEFVRLPDGTKLFAAPVVQPDMIRPDQEALQQIIAAALYDFGGFITTRQKQLVASATDNAADTVEALKEFMEKRGINPCQDVPVLSWQCWIAAAEGKSNANVCGLPHGKD